MHAYLADKLFQMHSTSGEQPDEEADNLQGERSFLLHLSTWKTILTSTKKGGKCIKNT